MENLQDILKKLNESSNLEDNFVFIDSLNLSDSDLKLILEAKYSSNRKVLGLAYKKWGERLIDSSYVSAVNAVIHSGSSLPIESGALG